MRNRDAEIVGCCIQLCTCCCVSLCQVAFQQGEERTLRESKDNIKCFLGVIIGILLIVGVIVGTEAQNRISSIANISESSYQCIQGCQSQPINLQGQCCASKTGGAYCKTIDQCKSLATKQYHSFLIYGFATAGLMGVISIGIIAHYCRKCCQNNANIPQQQVQRRKKKNLLINESQPNQAHMGEGSASQEVKRALTLCWEVNPAEDKMLLNNQELQCRICHDRLLGQKIIQQKCCGAFNHRKCFKRWILHKKACVSCKRVILL